MPFFTPDIDSIDIAGRGSLEAEAISETTAEAKAEATAKAKIVTMGLFLFELIRPACLWSKIPGPL